MSLPVTPAERHRTIAGRFGELVHATADWGRPAPVDGWTAGSVVEHLVGWLPALLASGADVTLPPGPDPGEDPAGAWAHHVAQVQALLDDPETATRSLHHEHIPPMPLDQAIDRFYTTDVFLHTWDLARATGQDDTLDAETCAQLLEGMQPLEELLRSSGQYGAAVPVPPGAPVQDRLIGFIGRDPAWRPR